MGNANEKALMEQVARSPAVQNIVHETAAKLARVLSASVIEMCRQILAQPTESPARDRSVLLRRTCRGAVRQRQRRGSSGGDGDVHVYGSIHITINNQPFNSAKYEREARDVVHRARRKIIDCSVDDARERASSGLSSKVRRDDKWEFYCDED